MKGESTGGKTQRPAPDAFLRIDKTTTDTLVCTFAGYDNTPDGLGSEGSQQRLVLPERVPALRFENPTLHMPLSGMEKYSMLNAA